MVVVELGNLVAVGATKRSRSVPVVLRRHVGVFAVGLLRARGIQRLPRWHWVRSSKPEHDLQEPSVRHGIFPPPFKIVFWFDERQALYLFFHVGLRHPHQKLLQFRPSLLGYGNGGTRTRPLGRSTISGPLSRSWSRRRRRRGRCLTRILLWRRHRNGLNARGRIRRHVLRHRGRLCIVQLIAEIRCGARARSSRLFPPL